MTAHTHPSPFRKVTTLKTGGLGGSSPTPEQAAAIVAALEQFVRETAQPTASAAPPPPLDRWRQTALVEGVSREPGGEHGDDSAHPWIDSPHPWINT